MLAVYCHLSLSTIIMDNAASSIAPATAYNAQTAISSVFGFIVVCLSLYYSLMWGYFVIILGAVAISFFAAFLATRVVQNQSD